MVAPLESVTVLDLSRVLAPPFATHLLSDFGATVWQVEELTSDDIRKWGAHHFDTSNRGKRSLPIKLKDERRQGLVRSRTENIHVFVENCKAGDLGRYGLGYEHLSKANDRLIYLSVTGFVQHGPRRDQPGYDSVVKAMTGIMSATGEPDRPPQGSASRGSMP